ncbi:MAG: response regulator [Candidatus Binatota bacterium]
MGQANPRIMIVESFGSNIRSLSNHLSVFPLPLEIVSAADGLTALTQLQREVVDLVVVDSCLRGKVDGFELCRAFRSSFSDNHIPIILILSGCLSLERSKGISVGADLLLHRPVVKEELLRMVQLLLGWKFNVIANLPFPAAEDRPLRRLHSVS